MQGDGWKPVALTDSVLVQRAQDGDAGAYGLLYERYHDRLRRVARQYLRDAGEVEDAVHDTFTKVYVALKEGRYKHYGRLDSYLCLACARICLDKLARFSFKAEYHAGLGQNGDSLYLLTDTGTGAHDDEALVSLLAQERREAVFRLIESLSDREAAAMALVGSGMTMAQSSVHLGCTVPAVKALLWRGRAKAEALIENDPRFDAIKPEAMTRRRNDSRAQSQPTTEGLFDR